MCASTRVSVAMWRFQWLSAYHEWRDYSDMIRLLLDKIFFFYSLVALSLNSHCTELATRLDCATYISLYARHPALFPNSDSWLLSDLLREFPWSHTQTPSSRASRLKTLGPCRVGTSQSDP